MKKTLAAIFALGILAALPADAQAGAVRPTLGTEAASAIVKVEWDDYHGRYRSHNRHGSSSGGFGYGEREGGYGGHYRWRSHNRHGSSSGGFGYGERDRDGGHERHRSHHRYGSGGFGYN